MVNKFFVTREGKSHQGTDRIHFAENLPRTLSIQDAKELIAVLSDLLKEPTETPAIAPEPEPEPEPESYISETIDSGD